MDSTMSPQGASSASPMSATPVVLPPDFLDANIDDIVNLIGELLGHESLSTA